MPMKILHIITCLDTGGAEKILESLIKHTRNSFEIKVISLTTKGVIAEDLEQLNIPVEALGMRSPLSAPIMVYKLIKAIKSYNPDVVQTWMYYSDFLGGIAAKVCRKKSIIWGIHNTDILNGTGLSKLAFIVAKLCALLSHFIPSTVVCVANAGLINHKKIGYSSRKLKVISNGYDIEHFEKSRDFREQARKQFKINENAFVIGSIGRFNAYKDHKNFIDAAALILREHPNVYFLIAGKDLTTDNSTLNGWIANTQKSNNFLLIGEQKDVRHCYAAMDVFCLHSCSEGFPNVLGEAMSTKLPCITTDVGDTAYMLGEHGLIAPPQNPKELAEAIKKYIFMSETERQRIGSEASQRIKEKFSIEVMVKEYMQLYDAN